jgi:hypothetical protein
MGIERAFSVCVLFSLSLGISLSAMTKGDLESVQQSFFSKSPELKQDCTYLFSKKADYIRLFVSQAQKIDYYDSRSVAKVGIDLLAARSVAVMEMFYSEIITGISRFDENLQRGFSADENLPPSDRTLAYCQLFSKFNLREDGIMMIVNSPDFIGIFKVYQEPQFEAILFGYIDFILRYSSDKSMICAGIIPHLTEIFETMKANNCSREAYNKVFFALLYMGVCGNPIADKETCEIIRISAPKESYNDFLSFRSTAKR